MVKGEVLPVEVLTLLVVVKPRILSKVALLSVVQGSCGPDDESRPLLLPVGDGVLIVSTESLLRSLLSSSSAWKDLLRL